MATPPSTFTHSHSHSRHHRRSSSKRTASLSTIDVVPPSPSLPVYSREFLSSPYLPLDQPPDYPDSANEADHESDDNFFKPPLSPRNNKRKSNNRVVSASGHLRSRSTTKLPYIAPNLPATASDTHLDSLLERSVHALELSNSLLQSSMSTQSSLSAIVNNNEFDDADKLLDARARVLSSRIRTNRNVHQRWFDDLDDLAEDVENLYQASRSVHTGSPSSLSQSAPSSSASVLPRLNRRVHQNSLDIRSDELVHGRLHSHAQLRHLASPPPRAMTQYVSVGSECGDASETTANPSSIYLPSTLGLRVGTHIQSFDSPRSTSTIMPTYPSSGNSLRRSNSSPSTRHSSYVLLLPFYASHASFYAILTNIISLPSRRNSRPLAPQYHESRSRSRSSNKLPSPATPRVIPPPIEELPSQSDSSTDSPQDNPTFRTMECLRKILDEMPPPTDEKVAVSVKPSARSPRFAPRSPPVEPTISTSTTTTSISRLFTKNRHSTSTRAPSPPRQSSLKHRPPPLLTTQLSVSDISASQSANSSGRSTPRTVAFGPLPESYAGSKGNSLSRFRERKEAKARAKSDKAKRSAKTSREKDGSEKGKDSDVNSWWSIWLTGGSGMSVSSSRHEERSEDRMARSWTRPGFGVGGGSLDDWPV